MCRRGIGDSRQHRDHRDLSERRFEGGVGYTHPVPLRNTSAGRSLGRNPSDFCSCGDRVFCAPSRNRICANAGGWRRSGPRIDAIEKNQPRKAAQQRGTPDHPAPDVPDATGKKWRGFGRPPTRRESTAPTGRHCHGQNGKVPPDRRRRANLIEPTDPDHPRAGYYPIWA